MTENIKIAEVRFQDAVERYESDCSDYYGDQTGWYSAPSIRALLESLYTLIDARIAHANNG